MLLEYLLSIQEDALLDTRNALVDRAVKAVDWSNLSRQEAIETVLSYIRRRDNDLFDSMSNDKIRKMIEIRIPTLEADESAENQEEFEQKLIASATGFNVIETKAEQVSLTDSDGKVLVTMPLLIWKELARSTTVG